MKTVCDADKCNACRVCEYRCPRKCITIDGNFYSNNALIDESMCISCGLCKRVCPNTNLVELVHPFVWKQGWISGHYRQKTSSGGIAYGMMKNFIKNGGYIASCMLLNGEFAFKLTNSPNDLDQFIGSKYIKSDPFLSYKDIEVAIEENKVLFLGLPCQVAAIKNLINNDNKGNLYTIDLICHGTPNQLILKKYLNDVSIEIDNVSTIKFRNKSKYGLIVDGKEMGKPYKIDEYISAFLEGIDYTSNCYQCRYACIERVGDVTLGDSWGSELKSEEKKGISLILVQTEHGMELLNNCGAELFDVDLQNAIRFNHQLEHPVQAKLRRTIFMKLLSLNYSFIKAFYIAFPQRLLKNGIKKILFSIRKGR